MILLDIGGLVDAVEFAPAIGIAECQAGSPGRAEYPSKIGLHTEREAANMRIPGRCVAVAVQARKASEAA